MVNIIGYDVGGANTKAAFVSFKEGELEKAEGAAEYFPVWKQPEKVVDVLLTLKKQLGTVRLDGVGLTMTAELSDAFQTKREGVTHILGCVKKAFPDLPIYVLNTEAKMEQLDVAKQAPLEVAGANWAATGWLVAKHLADCVVIDVGSTSTSIIPIVNGKVAARGKTDLDKLICGELVYTGSLRTNVAAIVQSIPTSKGVATVASELFALSGDVHLALGNITEKQFSSETADGRGKSLPEAYARLARVICADTEMLTLPEIIEIAQYIYSKQILQVGAGLSKVYDYTKPLVSGKLPVVVTGIGKNFIAKQAATNLGVDSIIDLGTLWPINAIYATPALGVALMAAELLEGEDHK